MNITKTSISSWPLRQPALMPPAFENARNRRQKVRAAGMHPDYWYPVAWEQDLTPGAVTEAVFWNRSIALYRGQDRRIHALENRCAHRQLKLSLGHVHDCNLTCIYHGWEYDATGRCVHVPHDLFNSKFPDVRIGSYPVQVQHGIVWIFPGNTVLSSERKIPPIPELDEPTDWGMMRLDFTWHAHHSMIIDNISDFSHAYLHRRRKPFVDAQLTGLEAVGDAVLLSYDTMVGAGRVSGLFVNRKATNTRSIKIAYEYPYQCSNTDNKIKHWCFLLPISEVATRVFFIFYFSPEVFNVPFIGIKAPVSLVRKLVMPIAQRLLLRPLLAEDGVAVEAEQEAWGQHYELPIPDLNPAVRECQRLTVRKWEEHLGNSSRPPLGT